MTDYNDGQIHGWNGGDCPVHTKTVVEPKVIWVNEYPEELVAHHDMLSAISSSTPRATRIAVKYVEARDD